MPPSTRRSSIGDAWTRCTKIAKPILVARPWSHLPGKLSCHSDYADPETAKAVQREKLVQVNVAPVFGIAKEDRVV